MPTTSRRRLFGFATWAIMPCVVIFVIFGLYPAFELVRLAFSNVNLTNGAFTESFTGFTNFSGLAHDSIGTDSVVNTIVFTALSVPLTLLAGTALAVLVDRAVLLARPARGVLLLPMAVAPVVVSVVWLLVLNPNIGALNKLFNTIGLPEQTWLGSRAGAMAMIVVVDVWHWTPLVFLLIYTALRGFDQELLEAARVDGATEWQAFYRVVLPLLGPVVGAAALIRLVMCVKAFDEMYLLTGGGPGDATTLVSLHIRSVFFDDLKLGYGAAYSVAVVGAIIVVLAFVAVIRRGLLKGWSTR